MNFNNAIIVCKFIIKMMEESSNNCAIAVPQIIQKLEEEGCDSSKVDLLAQGFEYGVKSISLTYKREIEKLIKELEEIQKNDH